MKTIILYGRRNTGMIVLLYLLAKGFKVKVITDDVDIINLARIFGVFIISFETMGEFNLFICCHGQSIIPKKYLQKGKMINIHPCLRWYPGHNPIQKYINNKNTIGSVEVQYLIEKVDAGELICAEVFKTPVCHTHQDFYNLALHYYPKVLDNALKLLNV
jgi:methionyl-tRNA formyltransferase